MRADQPTKTKPTLVLITGPDGTKNQTRVYDTQSDGGDVADAIDAKFKELGISLEWGAPKPRGKRKK